MSPQLIQIAECLNEANTREIKIARCLAESLKRIQELEQSKTEASQQAKEAEKRFNANVRDLSEQLAKSREENSSTVQGLSEQIIAEREQFSAELDRTINQVIKINEQANIDLAKKMEPMVAIPAEIAAIKAELAVPSAQAEAPKSFNPRGAYEPGEKYKPFDYVSSNGSSYIALVENPTQPPSKKSKQWMLVAARGAGGGGDSSGGGTSNAGDKYLTSSTTSLTVSNGAKTLTVATGLAYSPTQDVTIANNADHHMHASVTSYNSTTGVLVVDVQQHTGTGTYAIWTVNVGGISSTGVPVGGDTGAFLVKASASNYDTTWTTVGTFSTLDVSGTAAIGTQNETWVAVGGSNLFPTIASDSAIYDDVDLLFAPKGYGQCVFGNSGWLYTTAASGAGSLLLNNGSDDSPNIKFCFSNYGNFGIDTAAGDWGGPFTNLLSQSLRFISQSDEAGGAVIAALDSAGNFAILGGFSLSKTITSSGTTGAQTINSSSGSVNFASAATSLVVTNSLVTTESVIHVTKATNNSIARLGAAVADNGSFTIYMDVAPTTEIRVNFIITN